VEVLRKNERQDETQFTEKKTVALALRKNERQDETQFTKKNCCISEFHNRPTPPPLSPLEC